MQRKGAWRIKVLREEGFEPSKSLRHYPIDNQKAGLKVAELTGLSDSLFLKKKE